MNKETLKKGRREKPIAGKSSGLKQPIKGILYIDLLALAIIVLLGIIIYSNSFGCSFHFDDMPRIVDNPAIRHLADVKAWWNNYPSRPVGIFTFALNYHFNQLDVRYWHLFNLIIHLINACLVWWFTLLILSSPALKDNPVIIQKKYVAFFTALLFVSHPLATQSVTYIVQRLASMVAMFYLLSLVLYMKGRLSDSGNKTKILLFAGSFISALLAMLTKENAFTLPFVILLMEILLLKTRLRSINFKESRVLLGLTAFSVLLILIPLKYSFSIFKPIPPTYIGNTYTLTSGNYFLTQFSVILKYIQLLFLPVNQNLEYDFPIATDFFAIRTLLSFLAILSLIILAIFLIKKYRIIAFGIFWFFLTLSVESGIIPISDVIYEHRTYLPSFGFFLILSTVISGLLVRRSKVLAFVIMVIVVIFNSYLTYERNKVWKDELTLWNDVVSKSPHKARALLNRGVAYGKLKQWDNSIADYTAAIGINPGYATAWSNRGIDYANLEQWEQSIADCSKAIAIDPKYTDAYYNRGVAYSKLKQWDKSIADYTSAVAIDPKYAKAFYDRAIDWGNLGNWDKSIADYSSVIAIDPVFAAAYYNRGIIRGILGEWNKAINDYTRAIGLEPKFANAYNNRGIAYHNLGQWDKAIDDFTSALEISPGFQDAYNNRSIDVANMQKDKNK